MLKFLNHPLDVRKKQKRGFSMIEILTGFVIISIAVLAFTPLITKQLKRNSSKDADCKNGIKYVKKTLTVDDMGSDGTWSIEEDNDLINTFTVTMAGGGGGGQPGQLFSPSNTSYTITSSDPSSDTQRFSPGFLSHWRDGFKVTESDMFLVGNITVKLLNAGSNGSCSKYYVADESHCKWPGSTYSVGCYAAHDMSGNSPNDNCIYCNHGCCDSRDNHCYMYSDNKDKWYNCDCKEYNNGEGGCSSKLTFGPEYEFSTVSNIVIQKVGDSTSTSFRLTKRGGSTPVTYSLNGCKLSGSNLKSIETSSNYEASDSISDYYGHRYGGGSNGTNAAQNGAIIFIYDNNSLAMAGQGGGGGGYAHFTQVVSPGVRKITVSVGQGGQGIPYGKSPDLAYFIKNDDGKTIKNPYIGGDTIVTVGNKTYTAHGGIFGMYPGQAATETTGGTYEYKSNVRMDKMSDYRCNKEERTGDGGDIYQDGCNSISASATETKSGGGSGSDPYNYLLSYSSGSNSYHVNIRTPSSLFINGGDGGSSYGAGGDGGCMTIKTVNEGGSTVKKKEGATNAKDCIGNENGKNGTQGGGGGGGSCSSKSKGTCGDGGKGGDGFVIIEYQVSCK